MGVRAVVLLCICTLLAACTSRQDGNVLTSQLQSVDAYIKTGQPDDALSLLKKAEKGAYSSYARIGVYRRYVLLGENARAERVLKNALKNLPKNLELSAVYAHFLLRFGRISEACSVAACLEGSAYGSLYSEAVLKKHAAPASPATGAVSQGLFLADDLIPVYIDAYHGTGDERWLRDSALVYLAVGNYPAAAALQPDRVGNVENAYFWALVQFDAGNLDACLASLSIPATGSYVPQMTALASDAYVMLGDRDSAEALRAPQINAWYHGIVPSLPASLFVNSALWSWAHDDYKRTYDLLITAVTTYPDDIAALVTYAAIAFQQQKEPVQSDLERTLRTTPLRTQQMAAYDSRPKMLLSDAISRLDAAIERQRAAHRDKGEGEYADDALVASRALYTLQSSPDMVSQARLAYIWQELEANEMQRNLYPPRLVQLAVHELLLYGKEEEARSLFEGYIDARYGLAGNPAAESGAGSDAAAAAGKAQKSRVTTDVFGGERTIPAPKIPKEVLYAAFGDRAARHVQEMDVWEGETSAYFALLDKNVVAAKRLYEYVLYESDSSVEAEVASAANLAVIYSSSGEKKSALALYGQAAGRCSDKSQKSDILYRSALLQVALNDAEGAKLSLEYSLALDPSNAKARLLRRSL